MRASSAPRRRRLAALLLIAAATAGVAGQSPAPLTAGQPMPALQGEFLSGREARLPAAAAGKVALVALGFTYDSRFAVEKWGKWFRDRYAQRPLVTMYEVPMMGRAARLGRVFIDRGMRKNTPESLHEQVITVYGDTSGWKRLVGFADAREDDAYLLLIDSSGVVRWTHQGPFDEAQTTALATAVDAALAAGGK